MTENLPEGFHILGEQPEATDGDGGRSYASAVAHQQAKLTENVRSKVDAQSSPVVDSLFTALSYAEKTELSARLLRGLTQAGKLAVYCRGDHALWTAAVAVQSELADLHLSLARMSMSGYWDGELA